MFGSTLPSIEEIDQRRQAAGFSQAELCREARISEGTYVKAKVGSHKTRGRTLRTIVAALDRLTSSQEAAE